MKKIAILATGLIACTQSYAYEHLSTERDETKVHIGVLHDNTSSDFTVETTGFKEEGSYSSTTNGLGIMYRPSELSFAVLALSKSYDDDTDSVSAAAFGLGYLYNRGKEHPIAFDLTRVESINDNSRGVTALSVDFGLHTSSTLSEVGLYISNIDDGGNRFEVNASGKVPITNQFNILIDGELGTSTRNEFEDLGLKLDRNLAVGGSIGIGADVSDNFQIAAIANLSKDMSSYSKNGGKLNTDIESLGFNIELTAKF